MGQLKVQHCVIRRRDFYGHELPYVPRMDSITVKAINKTAVHTGRTYRGQCARSQWVKSRSS